MANKPKSGKAHQAASRGRPAGTKNEHTLYVREAISKLVCDNVDNMQKWLDEIYAKKGAHVAWDCLISAMEYHIPKVQRVEWTGEDGGPVKGQFTLNIVGIENGKPRNDDPAD